MKNNLGNSQHLLFSIRGLKTIRYGKINIQLAIWIPSLYCALHFFLRVLY